MAALIHSFALVGIEAVAVTLAVEPDRMVRIVSGTPDAAYTLPARLLTLCGSTPATARRESRQSQPDQSPARVLYGQHHAPAELPKSAGSFDLPIAVGILAGSGQFKSEVLDQYAIVGELALDGSTRQVKGALSLSMAAAATHRLRGIIVPSANAGEAAVVEEIDVIAVNSLAQTIAFLAGELEIEPTPSRLNELFQELSHYDEDFADVRGQEMAKRAVTIAAAGSHNLLMV